jgi:heavy metal translocating P-type ATPase
MNTAIQTILRFLKHYKLFSLAIIALIVGLILQLAKKHVAAHWVVGTVAIIAVFPLLYDMWQDIKSGTYGIDILAATAIVTAVLLHQSWAAIVVVLMLTGGESLEDFAEQRSEKELDSLLQHAPQIAHVIRNRKTIDVQVSELHVGDKIIIKPGEVVPVDGIILEGSGDFDEASLTGESLPLSKQAGDSILSGSVNIANAITAKATATSEDSQYQQIIRLVRSASKTSSPFVRLADRYSIPFTITAYAIGAAVWIVSGHPIRFLEVIIVATPCPLLLAAPIALVCGMSRASRHGIIVKTGSALERLAEAKAIAFDKTGTLTQGKISVSDIKVFNGYSQPNVLAYAASLEQQSNHVIAQAIVTAATEQNIKVPKAKHVKELPGLGLQATLQGKTISVGRYSALQEQAVLFPKDFKQSSVTTTAAYVAINGQLAGIISLQDELRHNASSTLDSLRRQGLRNISLVTGDNQAAAKTIAKLLGIDTVHSEALPADKLRVLETATARPLVFVGDGVNDAPILTAADIGIALGARGSTAASESADMVIMLDDIERVNAAYTIAKRTFQIARQSILIGISLSLILMVIFATGKFPPLAGALLQEVVDVVVIFNALRALRG